MLGISLFSGCGGLDFGFEAAGFHIPFKNDFDKHSCNTLRLNGAEGVFEGPVEEVAEADIRKRIGSKRKAVDVLIGGPPCQPFSKSAYWSRGDTLRLQDPRANTLDEYFRIVEMVQPRAFLLENVHGISYSGKEEGFQFLISRIKEVNRRLGTNYQPVWNVLNAADYGVPQARVRFFMVAYRDGTRFQFPRPTHSNAEVPDRSLFTYNLKRYTTAWDAIGKIRPDKGEALTVGGRWAGLLPSIPEGENYLWHTNRKGGIPLFGWRTRYWCFLLKLAKDKPSWTLQAQPGSAIGPFHWYNRKLSWRELAAIQTFPKTFAITAPRVEIQRQVGNAVPSLLAEVLASAIRRQLEKKTKDEHALTLEVKHASRTPGPEAVMPVPEEYLHLRGEHAAHPGTGRGRAYRNDEVREQSAQGMEQSLWHRPVLAAGGE